MMWWQLSIAAVRVRRLDVGVGLRAAPPALLEGRVSAGHSLPHLRLQGDLGALLFAGVHCALEFYLLVC